jgi:serine/threonine-protein kinase
MSDVPSTRWDHIETLFVGALEQPSAERGAYLDRECAGDATLRREIDAMLAASESPTPLRIEQRLIDHLGAADRAHSLAPGTRVGAYRVDALIGEGGMGEVYRAERVDGHFEQQVALKVLRPGALSTDMVRRFRSERQILARLVHPDIAAILDGGQLEDGRPYLILQYVEGVTITEYCARHDLEIRDRLRLFKRVADAVQFAHGRLVVHCDLKPSNILITPTGEPRLLDFGIAKMVDPEDGVRTRSGVRMLTPEHAAPEQVLGEPTTTATDVYALGILLFQLLTGRRPFSITGRSPLDFEQALVHDAPPAPSAAAADTNTAKRLRGDLDRIVLMALRKEPSRRYDSAGQLADDVERYLSGLPVRAQPDTFAYRTRKLVARNRGSVTAAGVIVLLLAAFGVVSTLQASRVTRERDRAVQEHDAAESVIALLTNLFERSNPKIVPGGDTLRVAALLEEGERRVNELTSQPALQARMWRVLGNMHAARSRFDRAKTLLQRAYDTRQFVAGKNDSLAAAIYLELARVVEAYQGPDAARPMFDSSVAKLRKSLGTRHPDVAIGLEERAEIERDSVRRRGLLDSAQAIRGQRLTVDSMAMAGNFNREGSNHWSHARWALAYAYFDSSLRILDRLLPRDHGNRLAVMHNVASALGAIAEWDRADSLQRIILDARLRTSGPKTVEYANTLESAALIGANRPGHLAQTEAELRTSLTTYRQLLTPNHWRIDNTLRNLGLVVVRRGRFDEGMAILDSAIEMHRARQGDTSIALGYMHGQKSHALLMAGRVDEARQAAATADRLMRSKLPEDDSRHADLDSWLAISEFANGEIAGAVTHFMAARDGYARSVSATNPLMAMNGCALGAALAAAGRLDEATPLLREACPRHDRWGLSSPVVTKWGRDALARLRP